jgi:hypothetical protein
MLSVMAPSWKTKCEQAPPQPKTDLKMANGGSTVIEYSTHNPKIEAFVQIRTGKDGEKSLTTLNITT